jgi:hypothetical protein
MPRRLTAVGTGALILLTTALLAPKAATTHQPAAPTIQAVLDSMQQDLPFSPALATVSCPVERGPVKEGSDATRNKVSTYVNKTTIGHLRSFAKPSSYPKAARIAPNEDKTWQVTATLTQYKQETDGDIHLVLKDSSGRKMIAEIPFARCVPAASRWRSAITTASHVFTTAFHVTTSWHYVRRTVDIRGLGYFDPPHGQTGAAPNGIELHPAIYVHVH